MGRRGPALPGGRVKVIQPAEIGAVGAVHVQDGAIVKWGDILIELDPTGTLAECERLAQSF